MNRREIFRQFTEMSQKLVIFFTLPHKIMAFAAILHKFQKKMAFLLHPLISQQLNS